MFGIGRVQRAMAGRSLPRREVTAAEFRKAALKAGWARKVVDKHVKLAKAFGSYVQVGNELLKLN